MKEYIQYGKAWQRNINEYIEKGWEVIETTKDAEQHGSTDIVYHLGYPASKRIEELLGLLKKYEQFGLKDELFKQVAESNGDDIKDYVKGKGFYESDETAKFLSYYEKLVHKDEEGYRPKNSSITF